MEQISTKRSGIRCLKYKREGWLQHRRTYILTVFLILCAITQGYAQKSITGTVKDIQGTLLPGVNVKLKGSGTGASTDKNGRYALQISDLSGTLVFSYIGFNAYEVTINGRSTLDVVLQESDNSLEDVVVVGYGTKTKASLTGAVSSITSKELQTTTTPDVLNLMTGKLPGVRIAQRSSEPGNYVASFDIRNMGNPLVIVDGVPGDNFRTLDPNEIESITVLKDASAAVYGVRAANGVLLVTTKKGKAGESQISYSGTYGVSEFTRTLKPLNAEQNAVLNNESAFNTAYNASVNNGRISVPPPFSQQLINNYRDGTLPSTDWYDAVIDKYAPQATHNLSGRGGTEKMTYFFSLGYINEQGMWKSGDLYAKKYNVRSNLTAKITKDLEAEFLINGVKDSRHEPLETSAGIINMVVNMLPSLSPFANNDPKYLQNVFEQRNPYAGSIDEIGGYRQKDNLNVNGIFALNYTAPFLDGLRARVMYNQGVTNSNLKDWKKKHILYDYDVVTTVYKPTLANAPSRLTETTGKYTQSVMQGSLNYDKTFLKDHTLKATLVFEDTKRMVTGLTGFRQFSLDEVDQLYAGDVLNQSTTSAGTNLLFTGYAPQTYPLELRNQAYISKLAYDYKGKYLFEGTLNYNGSSKFAPGHQWGLFPAISGGWRISEEGFIKNNFAFINNLKFRASWGKLGDDGAASFQWLTGYNYPGPISVYGDATQTSVTGLNFRGLLNPDLTWYSAAITDIGLDGDFWNGKLNFSLDVFRRVREGLLTTRATSLPTTVGAALPQENLNSDQSNGFEIALGHANRIGDFRFNITGNMAFARNKNLHVERGKTLSSYDDWWLASNANNRLTNIFVGYGYDRMFNSREDLNNAPPQDGQGNRTLLPGDLKYEDWNEDGVIDTKDIYSVARTADKPEVTFASTIDLEWHGFDMNFLLQGGTSFFVRYKGLHLEGPLVYGRNGYSLFMDRWHRESETDPNSAWIPGKYPSTRAVQPNSGLQNWNASPFWIHDASYLRLKSLEVGYAIPQQLIKKLGAKRLRIFANGSNLLTWSKSAKMEDPELYNSQFGLEYPITKIYNFGLNVIF